MGNLFERNGAEFSFKREYRFALWRIWDDSLQKLMFIGLNPSTANEIDTDPTITRIKYFTRDLGYGGFYMLNLFTYITAYPEELKKCNNPMLNADIHFYAYLDKVEKIVFCWGNFKEAKNRANEVIKMFPQAYCFGKNKDGSPKHPLYLKSDTKLIPF